MVTEIKWFICNTIEICMTLEQAASVSHSGNCDEDVLALSQHPAIKKQTDQFDTVALKTELDGYGAWDDEELNDHNQNIQRIIWIAGCCIDES